MYERTQWTDIVKLSYTNDCGVILSDYILFASVICFVLIILIIIIYKEPTTSIGRKKMIVEIGPQYYIGIFFI